MPLERISDHADQAVDLFIEQFTDKPRLDALMLSYLGPVQELEGVLWDILASRVLDDATGEQLIVLGRIVGQSPIGTTANEYRLYIRTRILINKSRGRPDDVIAVALLAFNGVALEYTEDYPASFRVEALAPMTGLDPVTVASLLRLAKAAGTGMHLHYPIDAGDVFTLATGDVEQFDSTHGLSDDTETTGGRLLAAT